MTTDARWHTPADFAARIRIIPPEEGGRQMVAYNGLRWDFAYIEPNGRFGRRYMVWPLFCDAAGQPLTQELPLPVGEWLHARLFILNEALRQTLHRQLIRPGVSFYCLEGGPVAEGTVTEILSLFASRSAGWSGGPA